MTERKTCGTCGPDSSLCEWLVDSIYHNKVCRTLRGEYVQDTTPECSLHISFRQATKRAETAEDDYTRLSSEYDFIAKKSDEREAELKARIAELEGALLEDAKRIEAEADIVEEAFIDLDTAKARIAELEGAMRHMIDAVSAENVHRHEWEIDEDVTRALEQAGQALEVSDDG